MTSTEPAHFWLLQFRRMTHSRQSSSPDSGSRYSITRPFAIPVWRAGGRGNERRSKYGTGCGQNNAVAGLFVAMTFR